jgi:hypothetical protein
MHPDQPCEGHPFLRPEREEIIICKREKKKENKT